MNRLYRGWVAYHGFGYCGSKRSDGSRIPFGHRYDGYPTGEPQDSMTTLVAAGSCDQAPGTEFTALCVACGNRHRFVFTWLDREWPPDWIREESVVDPAFDWAWRHNFKAPYRECALLFRRHQAEKAADGFIEGVGC